MMKYFEKSSEGHAQFWFSLWVNDVAVLEVYGRIVLNSSVESKLELSILQKIINTRKKQELLFLF